MDAEHWHWLGYLHRAICLLSENSVKNPGTTAQASRQLMVGVPATLLDFSYDFYDFDGGNNPRDYTRSSPSGTTTIVAAFNSCWPLESTAILQAASISRRSAFETGGVYGDGATALLGHGFSLT